MTEPWTVFAGLGAVPLGLSGIWCFSDRSRRPIPNLWFVQSAAYIALATAIAVLIATFAYGPASTPLLGVQGLGFSLRVDIVSAIMLTLVSFIGLLVLRYSRIYLDGEKRQGVFTGWIAITLAAVMMLVLSGNIFHLLAAWIVINIGLRQLLLFYPENPGAWRAARKQFIMARLADAALAGALVSLWMGFGTGDISAIVEAAANDVSNNWVIAATIMLAIAALFMSAQFPAHGWLGEVMEAPTPVSALLHAGVVNAGGFLLIRFAEVMLLVPGVLAVLAVIGGFTALFASLVMLTQPAVKTSLAWSTIAQMGFMITQCGLALFSLALLHIVAHSLYKAHAFLASGSAVEIVSLTKRPGPIAIPDGWAVLRSFAVALLIYTVLVVLFGVETKSVQAIALGAILVSGVAYLIAQGLADEAPRALMIRTAIYAVLTSISYFALHGAAHWVTAGVLPEAPAPGPLEWAAIVLAISSFGVVAAAQATFPLWAYHPAAAGLRVHLANGLYANAILDRLLGTWKTIDEKPRN